MYQTGCIQNYRFQTMQRGNILMLCTTSYLSYYLICNLQNIHETKIITGRHIVIQSSIIHKRWQKLAHRFHWLAWKYLESVPVPNKHNASYTLSSKVQLIISTLSIWLQLKNNFNNWSNVCQATSINNFNPFGYFILHGIRFVQYYSSKS